MKNKIWIFFLMFIFAFQVSPGYAQNFLEKKVVELGKEVPDFSLQDIAREIHTLTDLKGKIVMLHFWSAQCPFVVRYEERLQNLVSDYAGEDLAILGINSNATESLEFMVEEAQKRNVNYPILIDPKNQVADQFGAVTTPHIYILDRDGKLVYEGAVDDQGWSETNTISRHYVREVLDALKNNQPVPVQESKTVGCTIKRDYEN